ncbi:MFS transporter [Methylobacterium sp. JK268]
MTNRQQEPASGTLLLLSGLAGTAMASTYALQPLLPEVARSFPASAWVAGLAAGAGPFGYVLGLLLLVPLGDALPVRSLVVHQSFCLAALLGVAAFARGEAIFLAALTLAGGAATVAAHCIGLAGRLAPDRQGRAVGFVVMGVSIGILAGRVLAGAVGERLGWPAPLAILAALAAAGGGAVRLRVPDIPPRSVFPGWPALLLSVPDALCRHAELRRATAVGCCWFAAFSSFWVALAFHLAEPPLSRGAAFAGGFGLIGIAGAVVAQLAGRMSDRWGSRTVVFVGLAGALAGFAILAMRPACLVALGLGALLMDAGCFAAHAATQAFILRTGGEARSRRYGAYMTLYWCAGALGAVAAPITFQAVGWRGLCAIDGALIATALGLHGRKGHLVAGPRAS